MLEVCDTNIPDPAGGTVALQVLLIVNTDLREAAPF